MAVSVICVNSQNIRFSICHISFSNVPRAYFVKRYVLQVSCHSVNFKKSSGYCLYLSDLFISQVITASKCYLQLNFRI